MPSSPVKFLLVGFDGLRPDMVTPELVGVTYANDVFFEHLCPGDLPDLTILWYGEVDVTYHTFGVGPQESQQVLQHVDAEFGRDLDWWHASDQSKSLQIVGISDQGHVTQKTKVATGDMLRDAGFEVGDHLEDGADLALIAGYGGSNRVRDKDPDLIQSSGMSVGAGVHGRLHPNELHSVCLASGSLFGNPRNMETHSGIVDIAPTILHGLGIAAPQTMEGRVLHEACAKGAIDPPDPVLESYETGAGRYRQVLHRTRIGESCNLDGGWRSA